MAAGTVYEFIIIIITRRGPHHQLWCTPKVVYTTSRGSHHQLWCTPKVVHTTEPLEAKTQQNSPVSQNHYILTGYSDDAKSKTKALRTRCLSSGGITS